MPYQRSPYGILVRRNQRPEPHRLRNLTVVVLVLATGALVWHKFKTPAATPTPPPEPEPRPTAVVIPKPIKPPTRQAIHTNAPAVPVVTPPTGTASTGASRVPVTPTLTPAAIDKLPATVRDLVEKITHTMASRQPQDAPLLKAYCDAELKGAASKTADTIKKLIDRPSIADIKDPLLKRLGDINLAMLFSGENSIWTEIVEVKRGDSRDRIAHEHRNTPAAIVRLNPNVDWNRIRPGQRVRVLKYPNATLVIHRKLRCADLTLLKDEKFFRRYQLTISEAVDLGIYEVKGESGHTARAHFRELGAGFAQKDRTELEMFLAPGSRITVSD